MNPPSLTGVILEDNHAGFFKGILSEGSILDVSTTLSTYNSSDSLSISSSGWTAYINSFIASSASW